MSEIITDKESLDDINQFGEENDFTGQRNRVIDSNDTEKIEID